MKNLRSNRGATLLELIAAVAVLSIVGLAAFTLLMFSIRTNNFIVDGSVASRDAGLLNNRLKLFFENKVDIVEKEAGEEYLVSLATTDGNGSAENVSLILMGEKLLCGEEIFCEDISAFQIEKIGSTRLIRVSYTIDDRDYVKLFRLQDPPSSQSQ